MSEVAIDQLLKICSGYIKEDQNFSLIKKAYEFAFQKHEGQFRKSGEPYVNHVVDAALTLAYLQVGPKPIAAALLHDVIEDCNVSFEELKAVFDEEIAVLVDSVTKIGKLKGYISLSDFQATNHRKIFIAMAKDIRVIFIKLADRLHNMRTLQYLSKEKQAKIAKETLDIYVPIAHRLGLAAIKMELEDLCLFYLDEEKYREIEILLARDKETRQQLVSMMHHDLEQLLTGHDISFSISGRDKSIYSIYKKMTFKGYKFEDIYDIMALRIITKTEVNCYEILGYIHAAYRPVPGRFKDYIALPKPNLYQSLHTCIVSPTGQTFEVQIRTEKMDEVAERGIAAHWRYKESNTYDPKKEQKEIEEKLHWFRDFVSINESDSDNLELIEALKKDVFEANVYVLSPKGRVIDLPAGATPIDFAYKIHTQVGHNAIGATVNGLLVPLNYVLKTGEVVAIKTTKHNQLPSERWLEFVQTSNARNSIKKALNKKEEDKEEIIEKGKALLFEHRDRKQLERQIENNLKLLSVKNEEELYYLIGNNSLTVQTVIERLERQSKQSLELIKEKNIRFASSSKEIIVDGTDSCKVDFANCCMPIPGDDIVGYISKGLGIKVHRRGCASILKEEKRLVNVFWNEAVIDKNRTYKVCLEMRAHDRQSLLIDIFNRLSQIKVPIIKVNAASIENTLTAIVTLTVAVGNKPELEQVFVALENVNGIYEIKRK